MPKKGSVLRVNIGWAIVVAAGIGSFILVRNSITNQRKETMRKQKALVNEVKQELHDQKN
jgi:hypothetical protein